MMSYWDMHGLLKGDESFGCYRNRLSRAACILSMFVVGVPCFLQTPRVHCGREECRAMLYQSKLWSFIKSNGVILK